jgi:hypothetical protein
VLSFSSYRTALAVVGANQGDCTSADANESQQESFLALANLHLATKQAHCRRDDGYGVDDCPRAGNEEHRSPFGVWGASPYGDDDPNPENEAQEYSEVQGGSLPGPARMFGQSLSEQREYCGNREIDEPKRFP